MSWMISGQSPSHHLFPLSNTHITDVGPEALLSPNISNITTTSTTQTQLVSPVNLTCEATGAPPLTYRWYRDGELLKGKIRPYLYIPDFSPEDRGNYSCEVINNEGKDESDGALLTIKGKNADRDSVDVDITWCIIILQVFVNIVFT